MDELCKSTDALLHSFRATGDALDSLSTNCATNRPTVTFPRESADVCKQLGHGIRNLHLQPEECRPKLTYKNQHSCFVRVASRHQLAIRRLKLRQQEIYNLYARYIKDPLRIPCTVPDILLLCGCAGTGKSEVTNCILD